MKPDTNTQSQRNANPRTAKKSKPEHESERDASQQKRGRKRSQLFSIFSVQIMHLHLWGHNLISIDAGREIWVLKNELSRAFGLCDSSLCWDRLPNDCRSKLALPNYDGGMSEIEIVSLKGLDIMTGDSEDPIKDVPSSVRQSNLTK